jgi:hypothetical protein
MAVAFFGGSGRTRPAKLPRSTRSSGSLHTQTFSSRVLLRPRIPPYNDPIRFGENSACSKFGSPRHTPAVRQRTHPPRFHSTLHSQRIGTPQRTASSFPCFDCISMAPLIPLQVTWRTPEAVPAPGGPRQLLFPAPSVPPWRQTHPLPSASAPRQKNSTSSISQLSPDLRRLPHRAQGSCATFKNRRKRSS